MQVRHICLTYGVVEKVPQRERAEFHSLRGLLKNPVAAAGFAEALTPSS